MCLTACLFLCLFVCLLVLGTCLRVLFELNLLLFDVNWIADSQDLWVKQERFF